MFCPKCGKENPDGSQFCASCGENFAENPATVDTVENVQAQVGQSSSQPQVVGPMQPQNYAPIGVPPTMVAAPMMEQKDKSWKAVTGLVLGIVGMIFWLLPILGAPVTITGLVFAILGRKTRRKTMATVATVLCSVGLVLTLINSALGVYMAVSIQSGKNPFTGKPLSTTSSPTKEQSSGSISSSTTVPQGYKRIGEKDYGYFNVPDNFVVYTNATDPAANMSYSNPSKSIVLTDYKYPKTLTYDQLLTHLRDTLTQGGYTPTETKTTIDGRDATHIIVSKNNSLTELFLIEEPSYIKYYSVDSTLSDDALISGNILYSYSLSK